MQAAGPDFTKHLIQMCEMLRTQITDENVVISPLSLFLAFGVMYQGACKRTQLQLDGFFHYDTARDLTQLLQALSAPTDGSVQLEVSNAIFSVPQFAFKSSFVRLLQAINTLQEHLDLTGDPAGAVEHINRFVADKTHQMIPSILTPDAINPETLFVLISAVYFKGPWGVEFDRHHELIPFAGTPTQMIATKAKMPHMVTDVYQSVAIPYAAPDTYFVAVMPKDFEAFRRSGRLFEIVNRTLTFTSEEDVNLKMPVFSTELSVDLKKTLSALGVKDAFSGDANFSKLSDTPVYISRAVHSARIDVDEKGPVAAAVTAEVIDYLGFDHSVDILLTKPFFYVIIDKRNVPLFYGELHTVNPV